MINRVALLAALLASSGSLAARVKPIYAIPAAVGGGVMLDSLGRYASDRADIARLTQTTSKGLERPVAQKVYDPLVGSVRTALSTILSGVPSVFIVPGQRLATEKGTNRFVRLSAKDRVAYAAGMNALSDKQKAPLIMLQKKLRQLALARLGAQALYGGSVLPFFIHRMLRPDHYPSAQQLEVGLGITGLLGGVLADALISISYRNSYADWVKKVLAKGYDVLRKEHAAQKDKK